MRIDLIKTKPNWHKTSHFLNCLLLGTLAILGGCNSKNDGGIDPAIVEQLPAKADLTGAHSEFIAKINQAYEVALSEEPTLESVIQLSRLYHANGYLQEALACYEVLVSLEPDNPKWKHLFAFILSTYGYAEDAEILWSEVIDLDGEYTPARIRLGDVYLKSNQLEASRAIYQSVLEEHPQNPYALLGSARVAIAEDKWQEAEVLLESASRYSDGKIGKDLLVTVYENLGQTELAQLIRGEVKASGSFVDIPDPWLADVMQECYDAAQLMNFGGIAAFGGDAWTGIEWIKRALEIDPENSMAHFQVGQLYHQTRQPALALKHFELACKFKPDFSDAWLKRAEIERNRGNDAQAEEIFYSGFMKCPRSPAYNLEYGRRLMRTGDNRQAQRYFKQSITLNPNEAIAYIAAATNLFSLNQNEAAKEYLEQALQVEPGNPIAMTTLCFYYIQNKDRESANEWLQKILRHPRINRADKLDLKLKFQTAFE